MRVGLGGISGTNILSIGRGVSVSGGGGAACTPHDQIDGSVASGSTFTHPADGVVAFDVAGLSNTTNDVYFRSQDSTHEWFLRLQSSGGSQLIEDNNGLSVRGSVGSGTIEPGMRIVIVMDGNTISVYINGVQAINYGSASNAATATDGRYETAGGSAANIADLKTWSLACRAEEGV